MALVHYAPQTAKTLGETPVFEYSIPEQSNAGIASLHILRAPRRARKPLSLQKQFPSCQQAN